MCGTKFAGARREFVLSLLSLFQQDNQCDLKTIVFILQTASTLAFLLMAAQGLFLSVPKCLDERGLQLLKGLTDVNRGFRFLTLFTAFSDIRRDSHSPSISTGYDSLEKCSVEGNLNHIPKNLQTNKKSEINSLGNGMKPNSKFRAGMCIAEVSL